MTHRRRIYLDNAATSWPKPEGVYAAVEHYQRVVGAPGGRGVYREAVEVDDAIHATRAAVANLLGASSPDQIVFASNGTDALNLAIHGTLKPGDHVVTSVVEHNSVLRPLRWLEDRGQIQVTRVGCDASGLVDPDDIRKAIRPETKLIALIHASNVTGTLQPAAEVGRIAREHDKLFLLDAAQTLGHVPISVQALGVDYLTAPGHKGLLGPLGTGLLYIRPGRPGLLECTKQGGTGSQSSTDRQPSSRPDKYESGNPNVPGLLGLRAGLDFIAQRGVESLHQHSSGLTRKLLDGLSLLPQVTVYGPGDATRQNGIAALNISQIEPRIAAARLDEEFGIQTRAGFQCAALAHRALGTLDQGGTVRISFGPFNDERDVDAALAAIAVLAEQPGRIPVSAVKCPCTESAIAQTNPWESAGVLASHVPNQRLQISAEGYTSISELIPGLRELWEQTLGDPEVTIAVLDGPVEQTHQALSSASLSRIGESADVQPFAGEIAASHGTHVASVIFGQHGSPVQGIAPHCSGLTRPIFFDGPDGSLRPCSQAELAEAIQDAVRAGANIINISGGEPSPSGRASPELVAAVKECSAKNVLIVAAAGNGGCKGLGPCDCVHVPGALPSVLAVGAMDRNGNPLEFSNCGEEYRSQGNLALGESVSGAVPGGFSAFSGTSFATPIVAGVAGLLLSLLRSAGSRPMSTQSARRF